MNQLDQRLVLCDLDHLLLGADGNLTQVVRDVLQLFVRRGGRFTVFSQRTPRAVRSILGSVRLNAPALVCGGAMAYHFADGTSRTLCSFAGQDADLFTRLPDAAGVGVALQMTDGTTRVLRMSEALERHLRQEWTPYLLANAADIKGEEVLRVLLYQDSKAVPMISLLEKSLGDRTAVLLGERAAADTLILTPRTVSGHEMLDAVCMPVGINPEDVLVLAGGMSMLELVRNASQSVAAADAPPELRLAAQKVTLTDAAAGSAVEVLYRMVRDAENLAFLFGGKSGTMKETHLPESQKWEAVFICLSVAAVILCAALAFYFAVPLQDTAIQPLPDTARLEQHILVDLNTAGLSALCTLPGVGESRARAILEYREQNGPFARVEDAACVPGLTQTVVDSWKGQATVS